MATADSPQFLTDAAQADSQREEVHLLLAHGAGAGSSSPFLSTMAKLIAARGVTVHRFDFAYMAARSTGSRRPPPRADTLIDEYRAAVDVAPRGAKLLIGGKSMGGRVASLIADALYADGRIAGLVCLGYPFHPPKAPDKLRTAHLLEMACPTLIIQGERDPFGGRGEVESYGLSLEITFKWAGDGDHDLGPRGASGFTRAANLAAAAEAIEAFATTLPLPSPTSASASRGNRPAAGVTPGKRSRPTSRRNR